ncbi:MAG TPA: hypothetical protein VF595_07350, partial [Tepidisphaeraceae bacterium]|jgi:glycogen operon protein
VRKFWKGEGGLMSEIATRLTGSSDLYERGGRKPYASINFITAHDGFTLQDLVSYNEKHNEANGEGNNDGANDNESWNCGVEGPTDDPAVLALRERQKRNLFATMMFSQGVPMIYGGDELSFSKNGNNNTYCQDNELTWLNWSLEDTRKKAFLDFVRTCTQIWSEEPALQRRNFFVGRRIRGSDIKDVSFFEPGGFEMNDKDWETDFAKCLGIRLAGDMLTDTDERGEPIKGDTLLLLVNSHWEEIPFTLPETINGDVWQTLVDTADPDRPLDIRIRPARELFPLYGRSVVLLRSIRPDDTAKPWSTTQVDAIRRGTQQSAPVTERGGPAL